MLFHRTTGHLGLFEGLSAHLLVQPPAKAASPRAQKCPGAVECLQGGRLHELPGQPVGIIIGLY